MSHFVSQNVTTTKLSTSFSPFRFIWGLEFMASTPKSTRLLSVDFRKWFCVSRIIGFRQHSDWGTFEIPIAFLQLIFDSFLFLIIIKVQNEKILWLHNIQLIHILLIAIQVYCNYRACYFSSIWLKRNSIKHMCFWTSLSYYYRSFMPYTYGNL